MLTSFRTVTSIIRVILLGFLVSNSGPDIIATKYGQATASSAQYELALFAGILPNASSGRAVQAFGRETIAQLAVIGCQHGSSVHGATCSEDCTTRMSYVSQYFAWLASYLGNIYTYRPYHSLHPGASPTRVTHSCGALSRAALDGYFGQHREGIAWAQHLGKSSMRTDIDEV